MRRSFSMLLLLLPLTLAAATPDSTTQSGDVFRDPRCPLRFTVPAGWRAELKQQKGSEENSICVVQVNPVGWTKMKAGMPAFSLDSRIEIELLDDGIDYQDAVLEANFYRDEESGEITTMSRGPGEKAVNCTVGRLQGVEGGASSRLFAHDDKLAPGQSRLATEITHRWLVKSPTGQLIAAHSNEWENYDVEAVARRILTTVTEP